jgi:hypothetical protein
MISTVGMVNGWCTLGHLALIWVAPTFAVAVSTVALLETVSLRLWLGRIAAATGRHLPRL